MTPPSPSLKLAFTRWIKQTAAMSDKELDSRASLLSAQIITQILVTTTIRPASSKVSPKQRKVKAQKNSDSLYITRPRSSRGALLTPTPSPKQVSTDSSWRSLNFTYAGRRISSINNSITLSTIINDFSKFRSRSESLSPK
ncbi:hypothetical protein HK100_009375 [Physocladia obscura]|uniref:Uncharacterized protein n=1 Tax=Physocladia obscura TaxID=109957 RepID=A0AAD5XKG6_9FUNG|nr:hypothetical protein HK100_009375 [Physocladia obscura]